MGVMVQGRNSLCGLRQDTASTDGSKANEDRSSPRSEPDRERPSQKQQKEKAGEEDPAVGRNWRVGWENRSESSGKGRSEQKEEGDQKTAGKKRFRTGAQDRQGEFDGESDLQDDVQQRKPAIERLERLFARCDEKARTGGLNELCRRKAKRRAEPPVTPSAGGQKEQQPDLQSEADHEKGSLSGCHVHLS